MTLREANDWINARVGAMTGEEEGGAVDAESGVRLLASGTEIDPEELWQLAQLWTMTALSELVNSDAPIRGLIRGVIEQAVIAGYLVGRDAGLEEAQIARESDE